MYLKNLFLILTSIAFVFVVHACNPPKNKQVAIQIFESFNLQLAKELQTNIQKNYGFNVIIWNPVDLPQQAFVNQKSPRYRADSLIAYLKRNKPDSIDFVLGLTTKDISTTKRDWKGSTLKPAYKYEDWGVFGLGYRPGPSCIVSSHRISGNAQTRLQRLKKITVHELGHNLGLKHCSSSDSCVMRDAAETIKTIDRVSVNLCTSCQAKI